MVKLVRDCEKEPKGKTFFSLQNVFGIKVFLYFSDSIHYYTFATYFNFQLLWKKTKL